MRCPRCGTENANNAEWCNLCSYSFSRDPRVAPDSHDATHAAPHEAPIPATGNGIPPSTASPATAPDTHGSQSFAHKQASEMRDHRRTAIRIGLILGAVAFVIIGIVILFILWQPPDMKTPTPPGWTVTGEKTISSYEALADEDVDCHYIFTNDNTGDCIVVGHTTKRFKDVPESDNHADVAAFFTEQRAEWEEYMSEIHDREGFDETLKAYEIVDMAYGGSALYMRYALVKEGEPYCKHFLAAYKDGYQLFVNIVMAGRTSGQDELDFLIANISFE